MAGSSFLFEKATRRPLLKASIRDGPSGMLVFRRSLRYSESSSDGFPDSNSR